LEQIASGEPVEYDGYAIEGALDLDKLTNLPSLQVDLFYEGPHDNLSEKKRLITSHVVVTNCSIKNGVNFNNTIFRAPVSFNNTSFQGHAGFRGAVFMEGVNLSSSQFFRYADFLGSAFDNHSYFNDSQFYDNAYFEGAALFDYANFSSSRFLGDADFECIYFDGIAYFERAGFSLEADFRRAGFNGTAGFWNARFNGKANFYDSAFNNFAGFSGAAFNSRATFLDSTFKDYANFKGAKFEWVADFQDSTFNGGADFDNSAFKDQADFTGAEFNGIATFLNATFAITDFTAAQFEKESHFEDASFIGKTTFENARFKEDALFDNAGFMDELNLARARYSKLFIRWHSIEKGGLVYDDAAYMSLMKNFKDSGYYEDYDACYYAYRKAHRSQEDWPSVPDWEEAIRKLIDYPLQWFYGYGTKPFHAFFWSLGIVMAFFLYWRWLGLGGPRDKTKEGLKDGEEWLDGDLTDILGYSVTVFLSGTKFFIDSPALPRIEGRSRSWMKKAFILERVLGALFSVLFFIAISGTIVRAS